MLKALIFVCAAVAAGAAAAQEQTAPQVLRPTEMSAAASACFLRGQAIVVQTPQPGEVLRRSCRPAPQWSPTSCSVTSAFSWCQ